MNEIPTNDTIRSWDRVGLLNDGIGIICGPVSDLVVIDLDGDGAVAAFQEQFPALCETRIIATGSGHGWHIYLRPEIMPRTTRMMSIPEVGNLELRAQGCYVVAPPTVHPNTGRRYVVQRDLPILRVHNLDNVRAWLYRFGMAKLRAAVSGPGVPAGRIPMTSDRRAIGFARAALEREIQAVRGAAPGGQNNRLNLAAYSLGQLIADGLLARDVVERGLLAAAVEIGQPELPSWRTIQSGINAGLKNPRSRRGG